MRAEALHVVVELFGDMVYTLMLRHFVRSQVQGMVWLRAIYIMFPPRLLFDPFCCGTFWPAFGSVPSVLLLFVVKLSRYSSSPFDDCLFPCTHSNSSICRSVNFFVLSFSSGLLHSASV